MKKMLTVLAASLACAAACAQTTQFEGYSAAFSLNRFSSSTSLTSEDGRLNYGGQSWNGSIQAAYGFALKANSVLSIGGTFTFGNVEGGGENFGIGESRYRAKNAYSIYVEPGFVLNEKTLAYAKLSSETAKGSAEVFGNPEYSKRIQGTGFGFGLRTMLDQNKFVQVEVKDINYGSADVGDGYTYKPKSVVGSIGLGMKF